jgi:protein-S-isoprenylcysteine O-methyltransferase Ste14
VRGYDLVSKFFLDLSTYLYAMIFVLFIFVLIVDFVLILGILVSIFFPEHRIWPPPRRDSWQFWVSWIFSLLGMIVSPLVGIIDYGSLGDGNWFNFLVGILTILVGVGVVLWGVIMLSMHQSLGLKGKLMIEGPYRYSRNPQYVGFILMCAGFILVPYSFMGLILGIVVASVFVILPFSEEPWLKQQYGEEYVEYCRRVPRFIGLRSFKPKIR